MLGFLKNVGVASGPASVPVKCTHVNCDCHQATKHWLIPAVLIATHTAVQVHEMSNHSVYTQNRLFLLVMPGAAVGVSYLQKHLQPAAAAAAAAGLACRTYVTTFGMYVVDYMHLILQGLAPAHVGSVLAWVGL